MITEQPRFLGLIPIGKKRVVQPGENIALATRAKIVQEGFRDVLQIEVVRSLQVVDNGHVVYITPIQRVPVQFENDKPEEINGMKIESSGCFWRNVYKYAPDKTTS